MRKIAKKLLSAILVLCVVVSALCSSLIGVNAANDSKLYNIVGSGIAAGTKVITMEVTLTDPAGMTNGKFDLMLGKDVIDDANFGTKVNDNGETVPDYDNYLSSADSFTLEQLVGKKTETREETNEVTSDFEWHEDTATATQWATSDPDGTASEWQSTGNTQTKDNWTAVSGSTQWATSDPDGTALEWQATGQNEQVDNWTETTVQLKLSEVPADTDTVKYVQGTKVQDNWANTSTAVKYVKTNYAENAVVTAAETAYTISSGVSPSATASGSVSAATDTLRWVGTGESKGTGFLGMGDKYYGVQEQTNDPTYNYTKRVNQPTTQYEYQKYENNPVTETEYQKYKKVYFKTTTTYGASELDTDGNNMIANINTYEYKDVEVPVYDEEGNQTGTTIERQKVLIDSHVESIGNKGTLLPNAYDKASGLWNTKIEITGGTKLDNTAFDINDFVNSNYDSLAGTTTNAITGEEADGRKYVYNMTDDYYESITDKALTMVPVTVVDGETTTTVNRYVNNINLLHSYYREYTTVDVATANLGYKISTVSEDSAGSMPSYSQYAQGFKDITFNTENPYTSITFTVTLDFTGLCDRISANSAVEKGNEIGTADDGVTTYRNNDAHSAGENYVHYGKKYQLNLINAEGAVADLSAADNNEITNFSHIHDGHISEETGKADPANIEAIKAAGLEKADNKTYFNLFDAKCNICGRVTPMLASTNLPYKEYIYDDEGVATGTQSAKTGMYTFNNYRNLTGVNLTYQADGTVSLNIHFPNTIEGEKFIITDQNGKVLRYSDTVPAAESKYAEIKDENDQDIGSKKSSYFAATKLDDGTGKYDGVLMSTAKMITIDNLSAKDADLTLYIARYSPKSSTETQLMGITHAISLSEYCKRVITGEEVYYLNSGDGAYDETKIEADKLVAAAFMNYANASKNALATTTHDYKAPIVYDQIDVLEFGDYLTDMGSNSTYWDSVVADNGETGADWNNAIIIDSAEEFVYICKAAGSVTKDKYYKVAEGIVGFNLAGSNLDINGTLEDNLAIIQGSGKNHAGGTSVAFQGNFDGNGVTVYGAVCPENSIYAGLFSCTKGDVTIKNVNVKLSSFSAKNAAGGIVGYHEMTLTANEAKTATNSSSALVLPALGSLTIENCSVTDCHIATTGTGYGHGSGAIVGFESNSWSDTNITYAANYVDESALLTSGSTKYYDADGDGKNTYYNGRWDIKNCYVNLDPTHLISAAALASGNRALHGGVLAFSTTNGDTTTYGANVTNCVVIGVKPYASTPNTQYSDVQHSGLESHFSNVYTDQESGSSIFIGYTYTRNFTGKVTQLTVDKMTGEAAKTNMSTLNWDTIWCANEGDYPSLYAPWNIPEVDNSTIYWDGTSTKTAPSEGRGTKDDPYIINSVAELAYISGQTKTNYTITDGKFYKIADGIKNIVLQPETYAADIMALSSAAETKAYFEANAANMKTWFYYGWEGSTFCGDIDFNGATVYGIYQVSANNAGLFSNVDAGAVFRNLTIKNSYMVSQSAEANYQVGAIAAVTNSATHGKSTNGLIWAQNCTVANNYMYNNVSSSAENNRAGVMFGASSDVIYIDDCLVYGNDATYGDGAKMPIYSAAHNSLKKSSNPTVPDGLVVELDTNSDPMYYNMIRNSIILGTTPYDVTQQAGARFNDARCCKNVYTDQLAGKVACASSTTISYQNSQLSQIETSDIIGLSAKINMPNLDWYDVMTNPDGVWHYSYFDDMPSLSPVNDSIIDGLAANYPQYAAVYNSIEFTADTLGAGTEYHANGTMSFGVYASGLNLKANPYMTFTFAFLGDYKQSENVVVNFKIDGEVISTVKASEMVNNEGAGRYHLYRLKNVPVTKLIKDITISASYNGGTEVELGTFGIAGFGQRLVEANNVEPSDYYATRIEATKALMFYIEAINTRYGA